ncbi:mRNA guanylyltransferase [Gracilaria domingensis]|nr:mRNA guanylyltransferase [Gracilaria domingensis]
MLYVSSPSRLDGIEVHGAIYEQHVVADCEQHVARAVRLLEGDVVVALDHTEMASRQRERHGARKAVHVLARVGGLLHEVLEVIMDLAEQRLAAGDGRKSELGHDAGGRGALGCAGGGRRGRGLRVTETEGGHVRGQRVGAGRKDVAA